MPSFPLSLSQWKYRIPITINGSLIDSNLTDFPVLVKLNSSRFNFSKARSDGDDLRFALPDGTLLKYERERHNAARQVAEYWVKIPSVLSGQNTTFYLYFGNPSALNGADPTNVWDANFLRVYHLKEDNNIVADSTINGKHGRKRSASKPAAVDAKIGIGQNYDGINDFITADPLNFSGSSTFTVEAWIKTTAYVAVIASCGDDTVNRNEFGWHFQVGWTTVGKLALIVNRSAGSHHYAQSLERVNDNNWHYCVGTYNGSNGAIKLYIDGIQDGEGTNNDRENQTTGDQKLGIGCSTQNDYPSNFYLNLLDEVRISNIVRSAAWIKASYHSGNDSLLSYGEEEKRSSIIPLII
jgi:hypothetical protein